MTMQMSEMIILCVTIVFNQTYMLRICVYINMKWNCVYYTISKDSMYNVYDCIQKILKFQYFTEISVFHRNQEPRTKISGKVFPRNLGSWFLIPGKY